MMELYPCSLLMTPLRYAFRGKTCEWMRRVLQDGVMEFVGSLFVHWWILATDAIVFPCSVFMNAATDHLPVLLTQYC